MVVGVESERPDFGFLCVVVAVVSTGSMFVIVTIHFFIHSFSLFFYFCFN